MTAAGPAPHHHPSDADAADDLASIGSVLDSLRADFPEITISKIRFLESEGLISPARTPSGYRQFTPVDVRRLRFVLSAQRDHYLPLKVIRARLAEFDADPSVGEPSLAAPGAPTAPAARASSPVPAPSMPATAAAPPAAAPAATPSAGGPGGPTGPGPGHRPAAGPSALLPRSGVRPDRDGRAGQVGQRGGSPLPPSSPLANASVPSPSPAPDRLLPVVSEAGVAGVPSPVTRAVLLAEDGVDEGLLAALELHGVLRPEADGTYEPEAVGVARTAAALAGLGVEPRLLRGLRAGADREVGLLTQLVTPVARHRGADAAANAEALSEQLAALSGRLHALLVGAGLRRGLRR